MPFTSQKQRAWMYSNKPAMAKRWEKETPKGRLPIKKTTMKKTKWEGSKADKKMDKKMGYKEGSKKDNAIDKKMAKKKTGKGMLASAMSKFNKK